MNWMLIGCLNVRMVNTSILSSINMNAEGFLKISANLFSLFGYQFFQNALIGGIIAAVACGLVGLFLILKKEAMIGDGISHTAFGGVAIGLLLGINPSANSFGSLCLSGFCYLIHAAEKDSCLRLRYRRHVGTWLLHRSNRN